MSGNDPHAGAGAPLARRCRDYCRAYFEHAAIESKQKIEQMRKVAKAHRNIIDVEPGLIDKQ